MLATPHTQHAEQVIAAARAGRHVFTDKPFALTKASVEAAAKACVDAQRVLAVGFNWRYQPALQEIRRMLQEGGLGRLLHIEGNFNGPIVKSAQSGPREPSSDPLTFPVLIMAGRQAVTGAR